VPAPVQGSEPAATPVQGVEPPADDFDSFTDLGPAPASGGGGDSFRPPEQTAAQADDIFEPASARTQTRSQTRSQTPMTSPRSDTSQPEFSQRIPARADTPFAPDDDLLDFDEEDLHTQAPLQAPLHESFEASGQSPRQAPAARASSGKQNAKQGRKGSGMLVAGLGLLLLLGAGGGYYVYTNGQNTGGLTAATLQSLPKPQTAATTRLPREGVLAQLDNMAVLAPMLNEAWKLDADDPVLLDTIRATEASLLTLARQWNASQFSDIASRIRAVSQALPSAVHDQNRVEGILSASAQVSAYSQVMALLEDKRYLTPAGDSVLDRITAVSATDYQKLRSSDQWQQMMASFSNSALEKLSQSRYEEAARLTEAALTLDADDAGFVALRSFLQGS